MVTFIEVIEGAHQGSRYKIAEGLTLGRSKADIVIKDPKISSTHGRITIDGKGQFVLIDLESNNGLYISGRRVKRVALLPGVVFEVGRTHFRVINVEEEEAPEFSRLITWRSILTEGLASLATTPSGERTFLQSFSPALKLTFTRGIQTDQEVVLGYGPRSAGANSLDIELLDEAAPEKAFELRPGPGQVDLINQAVGKVSVNNVSVESLALQDGDLISFGNTLIKVSYL